MSLETWKTLMETAEAAITAVAVLVGGVWAYFKFIKGRTFRPRVNPEIDAAWLGTEGDLGLHVLLRVENIGGTKVRLGKRGTGVQISHVAKEQDDAPAETQWELSRGFDAFVGHAWIEPGETITDELLVRLPTKPEVMEVKMRILLKRGAEISPFKRGGSSHQRKLSRRPRPDLPRRISQRNRRSAMAKFTNRIDQPEVEHRSSYEKKKETDAWEASKQQPEKVKPASESGKQSK